MTNPIDSKGKKLMKIEPNTQLGIHKHMEDLIFVDSGRIPTRIDQKYHWDVYSIENGKMEYMSLEEWIKWGYNMDLMREKVCNTDDCPFMTKMEFDEKNKQTVKTVTVCPHCGVFVSVGKVLHSCEPPASCSHQWFEMYKMNWMSCFEHRVANESAKLYEHCKCRGILLKCANCEIKKELWE